MVDEQGMHIIDMNAEKERLLILKSGIGGISFSPNDTYLISCEKF